MKMRNTKEIKAILTAIYCINQTSEHKDKDIALICDYAFRRLLNANTNMLGLCCIRRKKEDIMPEIMQILDEETKYKDFLEEYNANRT